jgi:hypothetical protein
MINTFFRDMTTVARLEFCLEHPTLVNPRSSNVGRSWYINEALWEACDILPEGRSKRALTYVAKTANAELHFGGTDAVGPAIKEAIELLKKSKVA